MLIVDRVSLRLELKPGTSLFVKLYCLFELGCRGSDGLFDPRLGPLPVSLGDHPFPTGYGRDKRPGPDRLEAASEHLVCVFAEATLVLRKRRLRHSGKRRRRCGDTSWSKPGIWHPWIYPVDSCSISWSCSYLIGDCAAIPI
ncbi:uncharacterized protein BDW70DRAFT_93790 [Aspergillus foveolatus]|uniref:uncharacterized protein n=1 Tax=Aspergillus foveolatus TaxID=210207 RepID=UPI003CCCCFEA